MELSEFYGRGRQDGLRAWDYKRRGNEPASWIRPPHPVPCMRGGNQADCAQCLDYWQGWNGALQDCYSRFVSSPQVR